MLSIKYNNIKAQHECQFKWKTQIKEKFIDNIYDSQNSIKVTINLQNKVKELEYLIIFF